MTVEAQSPFGILSYPHLFTPSANRMNSNAEPRYSSVLVFTPEDLQTPEYKAMRAAAANAAKEFFGDKLPNNMRSPFRHNEDRDNEPFASLPGGMFISPWSKQKPGIVDQRLQEILDPDRVWAGMKARATLRFFGYDNQGNKGVSVGLLNIQIIVDPSAARFDGRRAASNDFSVVDDGSGNGASADSEELFAESPF